MARKISVADDVFKWLKEEKGEKSYSELLRESKDQKTNLMKLNGINSLKNVEKEDMEEAVKQAESKTEKKLEEKLKPLRDEKGFSTHDESIEHLVENESRRKSLFGADKELSEWSEEDRIDIE